MVTIIASRYNYMLISILRLPRRVGQASKSSIWYGLCSNIHQSSFVSRQRHEQDDTENFARESSQTITSNSAKHFPLRKEQPSSSFERKGRLPPALTIRSGSQHLLKELKGITQIIPARVLRDLKSRRAITGMQERQKKTLQTLHDAATLGTKKPKKFIYNTVMSHLINSSKRGKVDGKEVSERCETLFCEMKKNRLIIPDTYSYNLLIQSSLLYLRQGTKIAPESEDKSIETASLPRALELLNEMKSGRPISRPNVFTYNIILNGLAEVAGYDPHVPNTMRRLLKEMNKSPKFTAPDVVSYSTAMKVLINSAKASGDMVLVDEALGMFDEMRDNCEQPPGVVAYGALMTGLVLKMKQGDEAAALSAMELLQTMQAPPPPQAPALSKAALIPSSDVVMKNSVANTRRPRKKDGSNEIVADIVLYRIVMSGLASLVEQGSDLAERQMSELLDRMRVDKIYPDVLAYSMAMHALVLQSRGDDTSAAEHCLDLFDEMRVAAAEKQAPCRPDLTTYNIALNALVKIAKAGDTSSSVRCLAILQEMKSLKRLQPDHITYNYALQVLAKVAVSVKDNDHVSKCLDLYDELRAKPDFKLREATAVVFNMLLQR